MNWEKVCETLEAEAKKLNAAQKKSDNEFGRMGMVIIYGVVNVAAKALRSGLYDEQPNIK